RFGNITFSMERYIFEEQRQFGIWEAFTKEMGLSVPKVQMLALEKNWKFRVDPTNIGNTQNWQETKDFRLWKDIQVERSWRQALPTAPESRIGWYVNNFEVPDLEDTGQKVYLQFSSIDAEAKIWINGQLVNERGYPHNGNYESWDEEFQ